MRTTFSVQLEARQIPGEATASGDPGKVHLVLNGSVLHPGNHSPKSWPWGRPTIRVRGSSFLSNPCGQCMKGLDEGFEG
jgi:hypothetical protein